MLFSGDMSQKRIQPVISITDEQGDPVWGRQGSDDMPSILRSEVLQKTVSGSFEVALSDSCSRLSAAQILNLVERAISGIALPNLQCYTKDGTALALQAPSGLHVELQVRSLLA